ncbi:MAG: molybdenum cofactor cytidylyltransferase [Solirubrobacteraceae bacterium]|jgi:molybdenum cofactor cytidylyltransferase|nr:molybdenum cofactor cytidylyltransferase [Solirubrobacteraceae bacterium]
MAPAEHPFVAGLVLAAGGSRRLGQPKQLLPFGGATLLDHTLGTARACAFDQLLCAIGGSADAVRSAVDLSGAEVIVNAGFGAGCSSSIAVAVAALDPRADVLVLLLGDQPGVTPATVGALLRGRGDAPLAVCRYDDGRGHPFAFGRETFGELGRLHGDKAVWRLLDERGEVVADVPVPGLVPLDVDTWDDYQAVLR